MSRSHCDFDLTKADQTFREQSSLGVHCSLARDFSEVLNRPAAVRAMGNEVGGGPAVGGSR